MKTDADSARAAIEASLRSWTQHLAAGHADSMAQFYTSDARLMPPDMPAQRGLDSMNAGFRQMVGLGTWHFTFTTDSVWAMGDHAFSTGTWTFHLAKNAGMPAWIDTAMSGKSMSHWVRQNGRWLIADDIYNSDRPATQPPPARR